jgi:hypothetical protein
MYWMVERLVPSQEGLSCVELVGWALGRSEEIVMWPRSHLGICLELLRKSVGIYSTHYALNGKQSCFFGRMKWVRLFLAYVEIVSDNWPCECWIKNRRFRDPFGFHHQGSIKTSSLIMRPRSLKRWFCISTLTRLVVRENFKIFIRRESFKSYISDVCVCLVDMYKAVDIITRA